MTVSASITKIRRLVGDVNSQQFTDAQIIPIFARMQQEFCRETLCEVKAVSLLAPPIINSCHCFSWEEGFLSGTSFAPWFRDSASSSSQAWELEADYTQSSIGGYTHTDGVGLSSQEAQHPIPFFWPDDFYKPIALTWNYKWVSQKSIDWVHEYRRDAFLNTGVVVDWFASLRDTRKKGFLTHSVPYTIGSTAFGSELLTNPNFDNGTTGWASSNSTISTADGGKVGSCLKVTGIGSSPSGTQTPTVVAGTRYRFVFYHKDIDATLVNPVWSIWDVQNKRYIKAATSETYVSTWTEVSYDFRVPAGCTSIIIYLRHNVGIGVTTSYYFDSTSLRELVSRDKYDMVGKALVADVFYGIYEAVPDRPTATGDAVALYEPFRKFLEYGCAAKLLAMDTPKRDKKRAVHYKARYEIGKQLTRGIIKKALVNRKLVLGGPRRYGGGRPPRPRFPDHYPEVRF